MCKSGDVLGAFIWCLFFDAGARKRHRPPPCPACGQRPRRPLRPPREVSSPQITVPTPREAMRSPSSTPPAACPATRAACTRPRCAVPAWCVGPRGSRRTRRRSCPGPSGTSFPPWRSGPEGGSGCDWVGYGWIWVVCSLVWSGFWGVNPLRGKMGVMTDVWIWSSLQGWQV